MWEELEGEHTWLWHRKWTRSFGFEQEAGNICVEGGGGCHLQRDFSTFLEAKYTVGSRNPFCSCSFIMCPNPDIAHLILLSESTC